MAETTPPNTNPLQIFEQYRRRMTALQLVLVNLLPVVTDLGRTNAALSQSGHDELVIAEKAALKPATDVLAMRRTNNFVSGFQVWTGGHEEPYAPGMLWTHFVPHSITKDELEAALIAGPDAKYGEPGNLDDSHLGRPAFHRMAALAHDFTVDTTLSLSQPEAYGAHEEYYPELYIAHCLMAELVDVSDPLVRDEDGIVRVECLRS